MCIDNESKRTYFSFKRHHSIKSTSRTDKKLPKENQVQARISKFSTAKIEHHMQQKDTI